VHSSRGRAIVINDLQQNKPWCNRVHSTK